MSFLDYFRNLTKTNVNSQDGATKSLNSPEEAVMELARLMSQTAQPSAANVDANGITFNQPQAQAQPSMSRLSFSDARYGNPKQLTKAGTLLSLLQNGLMGAAAGYSAQQAAAPSVAHGGRGADTFGAGFDVVSQQRQNWEQQQRYEDWQAQQPTRDAFAAAQLNKMTQPQVFHVPGTGLVDANGKLIRAEGEKPSPIDNRNDIYNEAIAHGATPEEALGAAYGVRSHSDTEQERYFESHPNANIVDFWKDKALAQRAGKGAGGPRRGSPGQFAMVDRKHGDEIQAAENFYSKTINALKRPKLLAPDATDTEKAQFAVDSQAYEEAKSRALDKLNRDKQAAEDAYAQSVNSLGGSAQPFKYLNLAPPKSKPLTKDIAADYLRRAGGD
jgi:hypothetical protein